MVSDVDIAALIDRVAKLEKRVAQLETATSAPATVVAKDPCPSCGGALKLTGEKDHPIFGITGLKVRTFACTKCGRAVERDWDPSQG